MTLEQLAHLTDEERRAWDAHSAAAETPWEMCGADSGVCRCHLVWSGAGDYVVCHIVTRDDESFTAGDGCDHVQAVRNGHAIVTAINILPAALEALADARRERAWLIEEVTRQTGATSEDVIDCMGVEGHKPVVNLKMDELWKARLAAERERDEARARVEELRRSLAVMATLVRLKYGNLDPEITAELRIAERLLTPGEDLAPRGVGAPDAAKGGGNDPDVTACLALRDAFGLSDPTERKAAWRDFLSAGGTPTPHGYATDATEDGDE